MSTNINETDFIIAVSVLGGVCVFLTCAVLGLSICSYILYKKIKKLDPFVNFKVRRPKLHHEQQQQQQQQRPTSLPLDDFKTVYDNPGYQNDYQQRRDLNPIAVRSKASFDNGNFSFGGSNGNKLPSNSFRNPDYLDLDSRFY